MIQKTRAYTSVGCPSHCPLYCLLVSPQTKPLIIAPAMFAEPWQLDWHLATAGLTAWAKCGSQA